jgi:hypothetical protein
VATLLASVLVLLVVGVFILILLIPVATVWITQTFYVYLLNEVSFTDAMRQGWKNSVFKKVLAYYRIGGSHLFYIEHSAGYGDDDPLYIYVCFHYLQPATGS